MAPFAENKQKISDIFGYFISSIFLFCIFIPFCE